jgi:hypothetical protein
VIAEKRFNICALSETKLKESGEFMMGSIKGVKTGAEERCQAWEGVEIMSSERMWSIVRKWRAVSSWIM